jgi:hypothetical protein
MIVEGLRGGVLADTFVGDRGDVIGEHEGGATAQPKVEGRRSPWGPGAFAPAQIEDPAGL